MEVLTINLAAIGLEGLTHLRWLIRLNALYPSGQIHYNLIAPFRVTLGCICTHLTRV